MRIVRLGIVLLAPWLCAFDGPDARQALDDAFRNLYGGDVLAAIELSVADGEPREQWVSYAYGRKQKGGETRTLVFTGDGKRDAARVLVFQREGVRDRVFVADGTRGNVRPVSVGEYKGALFGSDFNYADFRAHSADEFSIEVLGPDQLEGEPCRVLRLRPLEGPYTYQLAWVSERRPVILRTDYFDAKGLWKRYRLRPGNVERNLDYWVPMEDEMLDLRSGRHTLRRVRNIIVGADVPDDVFTLTQLARGRMPSF